jgi:hypothetical protein
MMVASIAASTLGRDRLGYYPKSFGTYSICCGGAMVMHLEGCATFVIMIARHWKLAGFMNASLDEPLSPEKAPLSV